eukprot:5010345-Amphidinium_carterae.1
MKLLEATLFLAWIRQRNMSACSNPAHLGHFECFFCALLRGPSSSSVLPKRNGYANSESCNLARALCQSQPMVLRIFDEFEKFIHFVFWFLEPSRCSWRCSALGVRALFRLT